MYARRPSLAQVLPQGGNPPMLPHPGGAVRQQEGGRGAVPCEKLRRLQRDLLAEGLPRARRRGADAGRPQEEIHEDVRGEAVVACSDGAWGRRRFLDGRSSSTRDRE